VLGHNVTVTNGDDSDPRTDDRIDTGLDARIDEVASLLLDARRVALLTGAGISTDSGIPDYRGPQGVWTRNPLAEKMSDIRWYVADAEVRKAAWQSRLRSRAWSAAPNAGHLALVDMQRSGRLHALVTQNVDGLHQESGIDPERVVEVHGTMRWSRCLSCGERLPMEVVLERVKAGEEDPACLRCDGMLKSDTISFGESLVPDVIERALRESEECDVLVAVGSTLSVTPVNSMVPIARNSGARVVIVNGGPTEMDPLAHVLLRGDISDLLGRLVERAGFRVG
jgi:NAD-dependent deacetylase